ncbi:hypothetical protein GQ43DRAFT_192727 [Delitschia confertaspora ATCC 74209]|uniref:Uncharacterized protein n=1 Tax=Delitschia confertaspora ATCC 74209 TaxID=1513339 RepID=A0A9P4JS94_9PLEO|nr:hypothetical protein GQ43DRAFT_192727 [Delitschia confertaspora ATCC 74209]
MTAMEALLITLEYVLLTIISEFVVVYTYRIFLHPLNRYFGPLFVKVTDWYSAIKALLARLHLVIYQDRQKYGPDVHLGPNELAFNTIEALHDIYRNGRLQKASGYLVTKMSPRTYNIFNAIDKTSTV